MPEAATFSAADQALCLGILKQIEVGRIDYELLRIELGLPSKGAAQVRWSRFNSKLKKGVASSLAKTVKATSREPSTPTTNPKRKGKTPAKKRKLDTSDEGEEAEIESRSVKKEGGGGEAGLMEAFQTPIRQLPTRRARVTNFKELAFDGEEEEEEKEEKEGFRDSGNGGSLKEEFEMEDLSDDEV
ncbi:hypothetical protein BDZ45DRAFT_678729 [Acephala macrosclerotiorum]|nr:hypothetical protein BDZ45DRAFT_678729 [Acephala macrosclerotiorum]